MNTQDMLRELIKNWNLTVGRVNSAFPELSKEERYAICSRIMSESLGLTSTIIAGKALQHTEQD